MHFDNGIGYTYNSINRMEYYYMKINFVSMENK